MGCGQNSEQMNNMALIKLNMSTSFIQPFIELMKLVIHSSPKLTLCLVPIIMIIIIYKLKTRQLLC